MAKEFIDHKAGQGQADRVGFVEAAEKARRKEGARNAVLSAAREPPSFGAFAME